MFFEFRKGYYPLSKLKISPQHNSFIQFISFMLDVIVGAAALAYRLSDDKSETKINRKDTNSSMKSLSRTSSSSSSSNNNQQPLEPATLIYHESARKIVFRDSIRRGQTHSPPANKVIPPLNRISETTRHPLKINQKDDTTKSSEVAKSGINETISHSDEKRNKKNLFSNIKSQKKNNNEQSRPISSNSCTSSVSSIASSAVDSTNYGTHVNTSIHHVPNGEETKHASASSQDSKPRVIIANYTPIIEPLETLDLTPDDQFQELLDSNPWTDPKKGTKNEDLWKSMTVAEKEVATMFLQEKCLVKTVKNSDWNEFIQKFYVEKEEDAKRQLHPSEYYIRKNTKNAGEEIKGKEHPFHSFVTSTSLLPSCGMKMRCYGSTLSYTTGVVFAIPKSFRKDSDISSSIIGDGIGVMSDHQDNEEDHHAALTKTWAWPSGYSAKTEFNIGHNGKLINGREEALVSLNTLRKMNHSYLYEESYAIAGRLVKGGLHIIPYNEIYVRVGGVGRIVDGKDCSIEETSNEQGDRASDNSGRTFNNGLGIPVALFVRTINYGDLIALLRLRARMCKYFGRKQMNGIPLLFCSPDYGIRILTENLQNNLLRTMSKNLNPFQNPLLMHKTQIENSSEQHLQQKYEELLDLDDDNIRDVLTPEECVCLAGGFGATDESVTNLLMDAMLHDSEKSEETVKNNEVNEKSSKLQDIVNEGLCYSVRSGDFHTARQLLILYTMVSSKVGETRKESSNCDAICAASTTDNNLGLSPKEERPNCCVDSNEINRKQSLSQENSLEYQKVSTFTSIKNMSLSDSESHLSNYTPPPPPPPLDTDRLRSATNSDGLLAVLGAAEVLKSMKNGGAKARVEEAAQAIEEWIEKSDSVTFRLASWRELKAAQGDLKIATEHDSSFMAFISNKAISNRKVFAKQLRDAIVSTNFESIRFLQAILQIVSNMNSPCLRLELLQFILGLDNRYSVAHVTRSVELAATCLNITAVESMQKNDFFGDKSTGEIPLLQ